MKRITILGASGYTGSLICEQLEEKQISFQAAARNPQKISSFNHCQKIFKMDAQNPEEVNAVLEQTDILINCIGPFSLLSQLIINEVKKYPIYYLDITGEQSFVKNSYDFKENKACLIHSCSFESALSDLMSYELLDENTEYKSIQTFYSFEQGGTSPGTRFTMKVHGFYDQYVVHNGQLQKNQNSFGLFNLKIPGMDKFNSAYFTPYPEIIFFSKHFKVKEAGSFSLMEESMVEFSLNSDLAAGKSLEQIVEKQARLFFEGPSKEERINQKAQLILHAVDVHDNQKTLVLKANDMYGITAGLILEAVTLLLKVELPLGKVMSPGEAFYKYDMFKSLISKFGLTIERFN